MTYQKLSLSEIYSARLRHIFNYSEYHTYDGTEVGEEVRIPCGNKLIIKPTEITLNEG